MSSIILFTVASGLLTAFVGLTLLERRYTHTWYEKIKKYGDTSVVAVNIYIVTSLKKVVKTISLQSVQMVLIRKMTLFIAHLAQSIESKAQDVTRKMNRTHNITLKTKSNFLREVATHKKGLDTQRIKRETSLSSPIKSESE